MPDNKWEIIEGIWMRYNCATRTYTTFDGQEITEQYLMSDMPLLRVETE